MCLSCKLSEITAQRFNAQQQRGKSIFFQTPDQSHISRQKMPPDVKCLTIEEEEGGKVNKSFSFQRQIQFTAADRQTDILVQMPDDECATTKENRLWPGRRDLDATSSASPARHLLSACDIHVSSLDYSVLME